MTSGQLENETHIEERERQRTKFSLREKKAAMGGLNSQLSISLFI